MVKNIDILASNIFSNNKENFKEIEQYLCNSKDDSLIWNALDINEALKIKDFSIYNDFPYLKRLIQKRIKAYKAVDFGKYTNPCFYLGKLKLCTFSNQDCEQIKEIVKKDKSFDYFNCTNLSNEDFLSSLVWGVNAYSLLIFEKQDIKCIGIVGIEVLADGWAITYYIIPKYRRKGYARKACTCIIENIMNHTIRDIVSTKKVDVYRKVHIGNKAIKGIIVTYSHHLTNCC